MPKYIVQHTHIKHGGKGDKEAALYAPGEEIELTEQEALTIGPNVQPAPEKKKEQKKEKE
jgi:hypothetical protein